MTIDKNRTADKLTIALSGRLDTTTAPSLDAALDSEIPATQALVLDFAGLDYVSSAGLRVLLKAQKLMSKKGGMTLIHVSEGIMDVFDITGFSDILTIE